MQTAKHPVDYAKAIAALVKELPADRAAQLYDFARFLLDESRQAAKSVITEDMQDNLTAEELAAEDALWEASFTRHADQFAALKAQAKADVKANKTFPMFNKRGEFIVE